MISFQENNNESQLTKSPERKEKLIRASELESLCLCSICYSKYNKNSKLARILHCGHTFCTECIESVQKFSTTVHLECPTCRAETKCLVNKISPNYVLMEMIQQCGLIEPSSDSTPSLESKMEGIAPCPETFPEIVEACYRNLIISVKTELTEAFEQKATEIAGDSPQKAVRQLTELGKRVRKVVRIACAEVDEISFSEDESENVRIKESFVTRGFRALSLPFRNLLRKIFSHHRNVVFRNPLNDSDESDESDGNEESDESGTDSEDESDSSDGSSSSESD